MKTSWKHFLLWQLPSASLVCALVVEGLAFCLSNVKMWRDRPDELALAVSKDPTNYRVLLFGDSVTRLSTVRFSLGAPREVGNLTTHGGIGLSGSLFLLQRYLRAHSSPEDVVFAVLPHLYQYDYLGDVRDARYNLWHTFNEPEERDFLRTHIPGINQRDWLPGVLDVRERIADPVFSFLRQWHRAPRIEVGSLDANADAPVEFAVRAEADEDQVFRNRRDAVRDGSHNALSVMGAEALRRLCNLGKNYGFRIEIVWPPRPDQLESVLTSNGALTALESGIRSIVDGRCNFGGFIDFNKIRSYPNSAFDNDLHLFGDGWEQRYAADMRKYLSGLLHPVPAHAIEAAGVGRSLPDRPTDAGAGGVAQ